MRAARGMLGEKHEGMMSERRDELERELAEKEIALREVRDAMSRYIGTAEVGGDWSKRERALLEQIADIKSELEEMDDDA
jgi:hypothetical protein